MNRPRWHRVVRVAAALALATVLTVAFSPQLALALSQTWYLTDITSGANRVMNRGSTAGGSAPISITKGTSVTWQANEAASLPVSFPAGTWTGNLHHVGTNLVNPTVIGIGSWNGTSFTSYGSASKSMSGGETWAFTISASAFTVPVGQYLAFKVSNNSGQNRTLIVATDGTSFVTSNSTAPSYPYLWESYKESAHTTVWGTVANPYSSATQTAYMFGSGFQAGANYAIGFYDGKGTNGDQGTKVGSDVSGTLSGDNLSAEFPLTYDPQATAGTWHAVVFDTAEGGPTANYSACSGAPGYVTEDDFEVGATAIPEFPTVLAAIGVAGLCFGIYYWMRKRMVYGVNRVC